MKITLTELIEILRREAQVTALLAERVVLKQEITDLLAGDAVLLAKAEAAFRKSEAVEAKMRDGIPPQP